MLIGLGFELANLGRNPLQLVLAAAGPVRFMLDVADMIECIQGRRTFMR